MGSALAAPVTVTTLAELQTALALPNPDIYIDGTIDATSVTLVEILSDNTRIHGDPGSKFIGQIWNDGKDDLVIENLTLSSPESRAFVMRGGTRPIFRNLVVDNSGTSTTSSGEWASFVINYSNASTLTEGLVMENVTFTNMGNYGITARNLKDFVFRNVTMHGPKQNGFWLGRQTGSGGVGKLTNACRDGIVDGCRVYDSGRIAIEVLHCKRVTVRNCQTIGFASMGISMGSVHEGQATGNLIKQTAETSTAYIGLELIGRNIVATGNTIIGDFYTAGGSGTAIAINPQQCVGRYRSTSRSDRDEPAHIWGRGEQRDGELWNFDISGGSLFHPSLRAGWEW